MPEPNVIVAGVSRINPPIETPVTEFIARERNGIAIHFDNGQVARLDPANRDSANYAEVFDELRRMNILAYVEIDPVRSVITRVLIPLVGTVSEVTLTPAGDAEVSIEVSHARHFLRANHPRFNDLLNVLRDAQTRRLMIAISENDNHEIIDARPSPHPILPAEQVAPPAVSKFLSFVSSVTLQQATELFDSMSGQSCDPKVVSPPCIPFLYPDDGCWGRAHQMCRLMITAGKQPGKVWIYGSLRVNTRNNPNCSVSWAWHVAPILQVSTIGGSEPYVIDPSLFGKPVPEATWKGLQGDPTAALVNTDASAFYRSASGTIQTDPTYGQTAQVLATFRLQLKMRALGTAGPPPYANCPGAPLVA